jgi:uncharacterized spore protein YtfJ
VNVNHLEATKTVVGDSAAGTAGTATITIDTLGFAYASVDVVVAKSSTASHTAASVLNSLALYQGDTTAATASVYTVSAPAASVAVTSQVSVIRLDLDLRGKQRYVKVDASAVGSLATNIVARLGKAEVGPDSASEMGALAKYSG